MLDVFAAVAFTSALVSADNLVDRCGPAGALDQQIQPRNRSGVISVRGAILHCNPWGCRRIQAGVCSGGGLLGSIDLLLAWSLANVTIGLAVLYGRRGVGLATAILVACAAVALAIVAIATISSLFGSLDVSEGRDSHRGPRG